VNEEREREREGENENVVDNGMRGRGEMSA
jgi:hypothetical protein